MEKPDMRPSRKKQICVKILKNLILYGLVPFAVFWILAQPVGDAVRASDPAIFLILLAALGAVGLNWLAYSAVRKKRPSTLVFAFGALCVLILLVVEYEALPVTNNLTSILAVIGGMLSLAFLARRAPVQARARVRRRPARSLFCDPFLSGISGDPRF